MRGSISNSKELKASIAFSEAAVPFVVPRLAKAALDDDPVEVRVLPCDASSAVGAVVAGEVDLAVAVASPDPPRDRLELGQAIGAEPRARVDERAQFGLAGGLAALANGLREGACRRADH